MKTAAAFIACLLPFLGHAAELNLATLSCDRYENEILPAAAAPQLAGAPKGADSINTVMWLFGYSVAKAGDHIMFGDALASFGFALDAECKGSPTTSLLSALTTVRPKHDKPMDLMTLTCETFESRHLDLARSDPESAATIMMWLYGFSVAESGSHMFDPGGAARFEAALTTGCTQHAESSLFDALQAVGKASSRR